MTDLIGQYSSVESVLRWNFFGSASVLGPKKLLVKLFFLEGQRSSAVSILDSGPSFAGLIPGISEELLMLVTLMDCAADKDFKCLD